MLKKIADARAKLEPWTLLAFRLGLGVVMTVKGWDKVANMDEWVGNLGHLGVPAPSISIWFAIGGELLGGLGILVGAITPVAAFGIASSMLVAIFSAHWKNGLLAKNGGYEYPLVCLVAALYLVARGAGPLSVDALVGKLRAPKDAVPPAATTGTSAS
jgi:putative oxidoreductase